MASSRGFLVSHLRRRQRPLGRARLNRWIPLVGCLFLACAGHSARTKDARDALNAGSPQRALASINQQLEVESEKQLPAETDGDQALLLLDRALVLQQLEQYQLSARDLETADKQVEMLDFSRSTADEIARYVFSDDSGPYKAPPYEKLMLNTMNMVNYLVQGNLSGARIEARRFAIMQKYLKDNANAGADLLGPGSYLAGFIFEKSKDPSSAILYYDEALRATPFKSLEAAVIDLAGQVPRPPEHIKKVLDGVHAPATQEAPSGGNASNQSAQAHGPLLAGLDAKSAAPAGAPVPGTDTTRIDPAAADTPASDAAASDAAAQAAPDAELLLVLSYGRVPAKEAVRLPIGLALKEVGDALAPQQRTLAEQRATAKAAVTWVNFPTLPKPTPIAYLGHAKVDGQELIVDVVSVDDLVVSAWNRAKGGVIASAITRAVTRAIAGETAEKVGGGVWGTLISLVGQGTMAAADTPDTRSWATLPARIGIARIKVPAGKHEIELTAGKYANKYSVDLPPGGWKALTLTALAQ